MRGFLPPSSWLLLLSFPSLYGYASGTGSRRAPLAPAINTPPPAWALAAPILTAKVTNLASLSANLVVTTKADELDPVGTLGTGISLREALRDVEAGGTVTFSAAVFDSAAPTANTITLTLGELAAQKDYTFDASGLAQPVILLGNGTQRLLAMYSNRTVTLKNLELRGGKGTSGLVANAGGAIYSAGNLMMIDCRVIGNSAPNFGGGIYAEAYTGHGSLTLVRCTVAGNTVTQKNSNSTNGGGLYLSAGNTRTLNTLIQQSTISGNNTNNPTSSAGGGIMHFCYNGIANLTLRQSTIAENHALTGAGIANQAIGTNNVANITCLHTTIANNSPLSLTNSSAAGLASFQQNAAATTISLTNSIIANNTAATWPDLYFAGTGTSLGGNVIGSNEILTPLSTDHVGTNTAPLDPLLAPLGDYGGTTQTLALRPGSVAWNAGIPQPAGVDQRGYPLLGSPDSGAYESGNAQNYNAWIWEQLPITSPASAFASTADLDADGASNLDEWLAGTVPTQASSTFLPTVTTAAAGQMLLEFPTLLGRNYTLQSSDTLSGATWNSGPTLAGTGGIMQFSAPTNGLRSFFRISISN